jgi:cytidyltransferase-like protein
MFDVVVLSGGFDPIHFGHARMIIAASKLGAEVIVGVNSDNWLERKKGYAFMPWSERAEMVESIKGVTKAMPFDDSDNSACELLRKVRAENPTASIAFANGGDRNTNNIPENDVAKKLAISLVWSVGGGKIQSSSDLVEKIKGKE